ncbi:MAG TPA: pentapeptide repeat-containing protein [Candidatus Saccharimonadales bacterium]|jgi:uncharacterized protein YjbI with pentapeptide repeats
MQPGAKRAILPPVAPKILSQLDGWAGVLAVELELAECTVRDKDFSGVQRLEAEGCKLFGVNFAGAKLAKLQTSDAVLDHIEAAGMRTSGAAGLRMVARNSRLTGADFGEGLFEDCVFEDVKFDEAGFRFSVFKRVRFVNCVLRNADFSSAKLSSVYFSGCEFEGANFDNVTCKSVDLRGEALSAIKGIFGLKDATISSEPVVQLAPLLAAAAGLDVDYET